VIEQQVAEGDLVATRLRGVGKHEHELAGIPASGTEVDVRAIAIHRIEDGRIVEHWSAVDSATLLSQLGAIELPDGP
jgi:predicted ester cyclase